MIIPGINTKGLLISGDKGTKFVTNMATNGQRGTWSRYKLKENVPIKENRITGRHLLSLASYSCNNMRTTETTPAKLRDKNSFSTWRSKTIPHTLTTR